MLLAVKHWLKQKLCNIWQWMKTHKKISDGNDNIWCGDSWWREWWKSKGNNLGLTNIVFLILFIHPFFILIFTRPTSFNTQSSSEIFPSFENQTDLFSDSIYKSGFTFQYSKHEIHLSSSHWLSIVVLEGLHFILNGPDISQFHLHFYWFKIPA